MCVAVYKSIGADYPVRVGLGMDPSRTGRQWAWRVLQVGGLTRGEWSGERADYDRRYSISGLGIP